MLEVYVFIKVVCHRAEFSRKLLESMRSYCDDSDKKRSFMKLYHVNKLQDFVRGKVKIDFHRHLSSAYRKKLGASEEAVESEEEEFGGWGSFEFADGGVSIKKSLGLASPFLSQIESLIKQDVAETPVVKMSVGMIESFNNKPLLSYPDLKSFVSSFLDSVRSPAPDKERFQEGLVEYVTKELLSYASEGRDSLDYKIVLVKNPSAPSSEESAQNNEESSSFKSFMSNLFPPMLSFHQNAGFSGELEVYTSR
jgi:hypothetical protein